MRVAVLLLAALGGCAAAATVPQPPAAPTLAYRCAEPQQISDHNGMMIVSIGVGACWPSPGPPR